MSTSMRHALLFAVSSAALLTAVPALAQTAPGTLATPVLAAGGSGGAAVAIDTAGGTAAIDLKGANRLIQWSSFNVGSGATVAYTDSSAVAGRLSVLNNVNAAGGLSQIYGAITAPSNVSVWLANPSGILFGGAGSFSGGSLVLTTAQIGATDQARFNGTAAGSLSGTMQLSGMTAAGGGITLGAGTNLALGTLIIAGQSIKVQGVINATGDVALVAAQSATVPLDLGSPISVTLTSGTTVASATLNASGTITAANVGLAVGAAGGYGALLSIDPAAKLTATAAGNGKILILAGYTNVSNTTVGLTSAGNFAGSNQVSLAGTLSASYLVDAESDTSLIGTNVVTSAGAGGTHLFSSRALTLNSVTSSNSNIGVLAFGDISIGTLTAATGIYLLSGGSMRLDTALAYGGDLGIQSTTQLTGRNPNGGANLYATGNINVIAGGNEVNPSGLALFAANAGGDVTVTAGTIGASFAEGKGNVSLSASGGPLIVTTVSAGKSATLVNKGVADTSIGTLVAGTSASLTSAGSTRLVSAFANGGDLTLTSGSQLTGRVTNGGTNLHASGNITATAKGLALLTTGAGGNVTVNAGTIGASTIQGNGNIALTAGGPLIVEAVNAGMNATLTNNGVTDLSIGTLVAGGAATLKSAGSIRVVSAFAYGGDLTLTSANQLTGRVTNGGTSLYAAGNINANVRGLALFTTGAGGDVTVMAGGIGASTVQANGNLSLTTSNGPLIVQKVNAGGTATLTNNGPVH